VLFHRTLAENIAYARPGATQAEIEHVVRSGVTVFLKAYGTDKLAAEEQAGQST